MTEDQYQEGDNVGIMTGWISGNKIAGPEQTYLVCMDLERSDVVALADQYLPPTGAIEGRPGNPRSHWLYYVHNVPAEAEVETAAGTRTAAEKAGLRVGPRKRAFKGPDGKPWIEMLASGQQFACPPSVHPSGETRIWHVDGAPATLDYGALWSAVCKLAEACGCTPVGQDKAKGKGGTAAGNAKGTSGPNSPGGEYTPWETAEGDWYLVPLSERVARARAYIAKLPPAIEGEHGQDKAYRFFRLVRNDFAISGSEGADQIAWDLYLEYNQTHCQPPWDLADSEELADFQHRFDDGLRPDPRYPYACKLNSGRPYNDPFLLAEHRRPRNWLSAAISCRISAIRPTASGGV
jgi:hypothetical protein